MLDGRYRVIGIARVYEPDGNHAWYWTTDFGGAVDPTSQAPGKSAQTQEIQEEQQSPENGTQDKEAQKLPDRPPGDRSLIENGAMNGGAVWEQEAKDGADLILGEGHARLGGYDDGADELRQKIRVGKNTQLAYDVKIETAESGPPSDRMLVRITNEKGEQLDVLRRYAASETNGWERLTIDFSRFAGRTVYVGFRARTDQSLLTTFYLDDVVLNSN
jgi:hypothetical protein